MTLWPLLLIFFAFADDELASERYCFSSTSEASDTLQKLKGIQVPSDISQLDNNCFTIQMRPHRRELIQRFVRSIAPDVMVSFSSAEIRRKKYYKRSKQIELHPANKSMKPIIIKDKECEIRGLMVGLIRTY